MPLNLIGVIRLSTDEQAREGRAGLDRQRHDIATVQAQTGARIIRTIEVIESGSLVRDDLQFQQMFRDVADPSVDGIAISHLDRLVRPTTHAEFGVLDHFRGKKIFTPDSGALDISTDAGFIEGTLRAMFSGMEKKEIKRRTMGGKARNRDKGWCVGGPQILARGVLYDRATHTYYYDLDPTLNVTRSKGHHPGDALLVRRAFHLLVVEDLSYEAIAAIIGAGWTGPGIRGSMANPIWIGFQQFGLESTGILRKSKKTGRNYSVVKRKADPQRMHVIEEPLIPVELFERAQEIIKGRAAKRGQRKDLPVGLLTGLLHCSCGKAWYWRRRGVRGRHRGIATESYYCSSRSRNYKRRAENKPCGACSISRLSLDQTVEEILTGKLLDLDFLQSVLDLQKAQRPVLNHQPQRERELADLNEEKARLLKAYLKRRITEEEFDRESKDIDSNILALNTLYPKPLVYPWNDGRDLAQILIEAFARFKRLPLEDRQLLLRRAIQRITINAQMISSITFHGGFLGEFAATLDGAKLPTSTSTCLGFSATPDLTIQFPQPIAIKELEGRRRIA
jgi:DNA invertase Pin-like site-specific DNA recombinase